MAHISTIAGNHITQYAPNESERHEVALESLWQDRTVVISFLRRFGCKLCRGPAKVLRLGCVDVVGAG